MSSVGTNSTRWMENHTAARASRIPEEEWELHRSTIVNLHAQGKTKQEIGIFMAKNFNFTPTQHQYTTQFRKWKLVRYNKSDAWMAEQGSHLTSGSSGNPAIQSESTRDLDMVMQDASDDQLPPSNPFIDCFATPSSLPRIERTNLALGTKQDHETDPFVDPLDLSELDLLEQRFDSPEARSKLPRPATRGIEEAQTLDTECDRDYPSETESVKTIEDPSSVRKSSLTPFKSDAADQDLKSSSVDDLNDSIYAMSIQDSLQNPFADEISTSSSRLHNSLDSNSVWESIASRSELSLATNRGSHIVALTDRSKAIPTYQYLDQLYPRKKLKRLRKFATEQLFCDYSALDTLYSILAQADFFRVSLLFADAFDLYLLAYMLLKDKKVEKRIEVHRYLALQALAGCAESARNLSQVRLCQEFLSGLRHEDKGDFIHATGFPLNYWQGHLASLENQSQHAAVCIQQAISDVGRLPFKDAACVTSVLVRELVARCQYMDLPCDASSAWLKDAQTRLNNGEFAVTIAAALRKLLEWCIDKIDGTKLEATVEDCFSSQASACIKSAGGDRVPQQTFMLVVHFYCAWTNENGTPADGISWWVPSATASRDGVADRSLSTDRVANSMEDVRRLRNRRGNAVNEAIRMIGSEMEINLLSIFATIARMIVEQSSSMMSATPGRDHWTTLRDNAVALTNMSGEELEASLVKAYFFVNARTPELGSGLHPRHYLRALAVYNMPRHLVTSDIGPDWLSETATMTAGSVRSISMRSPDGSTCNLLQHGTLPQISPRSSISVKVRDALVGAAKRKYQASDSSSRRSGGSRQGVPSKLLKVNNDPTGGSGSTERNRVEAEREFLIMLLGRSVTSLNLCE